MALDDIDTNEYPHKTTIYVFIQIPLVQFDKFYSVFPSEAAGKESHYTDLAKWVNVLLLV
jgi:hypothetical protein